MNQSKADIFTHTLQEKMILKTFDKKKGKMVFAGEIRDGNYCRKVSNRHYMVKEKGYGIQSTVFAELVKRNIKDVILSTPHTTLKAPLYIWMAKGRSRDYGHGEQVFLSVEFMLGVHHA